MSRQSERVLPGGWLHQGVLGFLGAVAVLLPMGAAGLIGPIPLAVLAAVGLGGWLLPAPPLPDRDAWMGPVAIGAFALLVPGLLIALAPPTDTDELFWHLAAPTRLLREGHLPGGWADPVASRPLPLQLIYAALMAVGGAEAAKLFHWGGAALLLAGIYGVTRAGWPVPATSGMPAGSPERSTTARSSFGVGPEGPTRERGTAAGAAWAVALLAGSWTFLEDAGLAHDNLPVALLVLASLDAALRADPVRMGLAAGAALSVKYTAAPAVAAVWLVLAWAEFREGRLARSLLAPLIAALPIAPWWARNLLEGLHPLFPYAGWPTHGGLVYAWPQKYGAGHDLVALLRLPVDLVFAARTDSFVFLGRLHPAWLLSAPIAVWAAVYDTRLRVLLAASVVGLVGWWFGVQWMRHLLPLAPVIAVMLGLAVSRAPDAILRMAFAAWALLLPAQVLDHVARAGAVVPVVTGATSAPDWYRANLPAWPAIDWVNTYTPPDAKVAFLFTGETALVDRTVVMGSVEDHTPTRWLAFAHGDDALGWLRDQGVTYVVVQRVGFIRKPYPFLSEAEFRAQFTDPEAKIRDLLLDQGRLVFESKRHSVWALDAPATGG